MANDRFMATSTFYNLDEEVSRVRSEIAKNSFRNALERGCRVVSVDGGSPDELLKEFESYGVIVLAEEQRGMGNARRQVIRAIAEDYEALATMWVEPEKDLSRFLDDIFGPIERDEADFVGVARKDRSSYPLFQQATEGLGNEIWRDITGVELDMFFGGRVWRKGLERYFLDYDGAAQDSIHVPVVDIVHAGYRVQNVVVDFSYPKEQRAVEEGPANAPTMKIKRLSQLTELSRQTLERWKYLESKK